MVLFRNSILIHNVLFVLKDRPYCYTINPKLSLDYVDVADDDAASEDADDKAEKFELRGVAGIDRSDRRLISRPSPSITNKTRMMARWRRRRSGLLHGGRQDTHNPWSGSCWHLARIPPHPR